MFDLNTIVAINDRAALAESLGVGLGIAGPSQARTSQQVAQRRKSLLAAALESHGYTKETAKRIAGLHVDANPIAPALDLGGAK